MGIAIEKKTGGMKNGWYRAVVSDDDGITYVGPYFPDEGMARIDGAKRSATAVPFRGQVKA